MFAARVHAASLEILSKTGVRVDSPRARALFARTGCEFQDDGRVFIQAMSIAKRVRNQRCLGQRKR